jgi:hypothetical protein
MDHGESKSVRDTSSTAPSKHCKVVRRICSTLSNATGGKIVFLLFSIKFINNNFLGNSSVRIPALKNDEEPHRKSSVPLLLQSSRKPSIPTALVSPLIVAGQTFGGGSVDLEWAFHVFKAGFCFSDSILLFTLGKKIASI